MGNHRDPPAQPQGCAWAQGGGRSQQQDTAAHGRSRSTRLHLASNHDAYMFQCKLLPSPTLKHPYFQGDKITKSCCPQDPRPSRFLPGDPPGWIWGQNRDPFERGFVTDCI